MPQISLTTGTRFVADVGVSLLDAAAKEGVSLPYSCRTGRCSTCRCRVLSGQTEALQSETGLTEDEKQAGWVLGCVRTAVSDVLLEAEDLGGITLPPVRTLPCRVSSLERLAPDVLKVILRIPPTSDFSFIPGQYVEVIGPGGMRRSYSLANAGASSKLLELHVREVDGGAMSDYWFNRAGVNDLLRINGPLGTFFLRDVAGFDLFFLATGTGIAPVKAMLEKLPHVSEEQQPRSITVIWGGRVESDLYTDIGALQGGHTFVPVLSRGGDDWLGRKGYVQNALLDICDDLTSASVYACGSDAMIHASREILLKAGLPKGRFYSDAFVCSATS